MRSPAFVRIRAMAAAEAGARRLSVGVAMAAATLVAACGSGTETDADRRPEVPARPRPNIVVIMADDLGYGDLSSDDGWIETPALDAMASEGVRFTDFHSSGAVCSPTRAGLLTGRYQQRAGIPNVIYANVLDVADVLPPEDRPLDGVSLLPHLLGGAAAEDRELFWAYQPARRPVEQLAMRHGTWKLIVNGPDGPDLALYNLDEDPGETTNLAADEPERVAAMGDALDNWRFEVEEGATVQPAPPLLRAGSGGAVIAAARLLDTPRPMERRVGWVEWTVPAA